MFGDEESFHAYIQILRTALPLANPDQIELSDNLNELGLDSLNTVALVVKLEDAFDVVLPDDALVADTFETAGSLWAVLTTIGNLGGKIA
jgi:acyl carrier protein